MLYVVMDFVIKFAVLELLVPITTMWLLESSRALGMLFSLDLHASFFHHLVRNAFGAIVSTTILPSTAKICGDTYTYRKALIKAP